MDDAADPHPLGADSQVSTDCPRAEVELADQATAEIDESWGVEGCWGVSPAGAEVGESAEGLGAYIGAGSSHCG